MSATVCAVVDDYKLEKQLERNRNYLCIHCSRSTIREVIIKPKDLRILDGQIEHVVAYRVGCPHRTKQTLYDRISSCYIGDTKVYRSESCANCAYAEPVRVEVRPAQVNQYRVEYKCYRIVYRCTNQQRVEQFPNGTHMCAYIRCDHYTETGK